MPDPCARRLSRLNPSRSNPSRRAALVGGLSVALLTLSACAAPFGGERDAPPPEGPVPDTAWVTAHGTALYRDGQPFTLQAISFDNAVGQDSQDAGRDRHHAPTAYAQLADLGINAVLFEFDEQWFERDRAGFLTWLDGNLALARRAGVGLVPWQRPPTEQAADATRLDDDDDPDARAANLWQQLASRYRDEPAILAYAPLLTDAPSGPGAWQNRIRRVVSAIRAVDERRLIIVARPPGSDPDAAGDAYPAPWLNDANVLYNASLALAADVGWPDDQSIVPTGLSLVDNQAQLHSNDLPAGNSDWAWYASDWRENPSDDAVAAVPRFTVRGPLGGRVQFSGLKVRERRIDGSERIVFDETLDADTVQDWQPFAQATAGDTVEPSREDLVDADGTPRLSLVLRGTGLSTVAGWQPPHGWFKVVPDARYRVEGRMRADQLRYIAGQRGSHVGVEIEFHAPLDKRTPVYRVNDKAALALRIDDAIGFGRRHGVPVSFLNVAVNGPVDASVGGEAWLEDVTALLQQSELGYGIGSYRGTRSGLYPTNWDQPAGQADAAMLRVLSSAGAR